MNRKSPLKINSLVTSVLKIIPLAALFLQCGIALAQNTTTVAEQQRLINPLATDSTVGQGAAPSPDSQNPLSLQLSSDILSDYIFRGQNLYRGLAIQPQILAAYTDDDLGVVSASAWSHISAQGDRNVQAFSEIDYTLSYAYTLEAATLSIGHLWYTYPRSGDNLNGTNEVFSSVSFATLLTPTISWYKDYREFDSNYFELGLSHEESINLFEKELAIQPYIKLGFGQNSKKYYAKDGLVQITYGLAAAIPLADFQITPSINYTYGIDELTIKRFWSGVNISYGW